MSWSSTDGDRAKVPSGGRVKRIIDEWRVAGHWWASEMRRDYYLVELEGGKLIELYREEESWCVTGISD